MPLPEAKPTPDKANIYEQFSNVTVADLTRDQLDIVRDPLNLNSQSEDVLRRINLIGAASNQMSVSGPLANTQFASESSSTAADIYTNFTPAFGEVWQIVGISATLASGITRIEFKIKDDVTSIYVEVGQADGSGASELEGYPILIGYPCSFVSHARGTYSSGTNTTYISAIRVR